jgi:hypothetical protein
MPDHQQPDALNLELPLKPQRIADHDLQATVEPVAIEFDYLIWSDGFADKFAFNHGDRWESQRNVLPALWWA